MARSWRNFFKRDTEELAESGVATQTEAPDSNGSVPSGSDPSGDEVSGDEVQAAEEVLAERREPEVVEAPVEEAEPGEVEEALPEPGVVEEAPDAEAAAEAAETQEAGGWFGRLRGGLRKSRESVVGQLNAAVAEFRDADDEEFWERVEEILIASDVGVTTTSKLVRELEQEAMERNLTSGEELRVLLIEHATRMLEGPVELDVSHDPTVILMVGVNGTGKTTTIGKLVNFLPGKAMLAAGDTFRAAAIEQLQRWGERTGAQRLLRTMRSKRQNEMVWMFCSSTRPGGCTPRST
jgi:fused signal recognition particle receptor